MQLAGLSLDKAGHGPSFAYCSKWYGSSFCRHHPPLSMGLVSSLIESPEVCLCCATPGPQQIFWCMVKKTGTTYAPVDENGNARMGIAIVCATHACLCVSSVPTSKVLRTTTIRRWSMNGLILSLNLVMWIDLTLAWTTSYAPSRLYINLQCAPTSSLVSSWQCNT